MRATTIVDAKGALVVAQKVGGSSPPRLANILLEAYVTERHAPLS